MEPVETMEHASVCLHQHIDVTASTTSQEAIVRLVMTWLVLYEFRHKHGHQENDGYTLMLVMLIQTANLHLHIADG